MEPSDGLEHAVKIRCTSCNSGFRIRSESIPPQGARSRCPNCREPILIGAPDPGKTPGKDAGSENLFDLPPSTMARIPESDDLFSLGSGPEWSTPSQGGPKSPDDSSSTATISTNGSLPPPSPEPRPGGLRGWWARLMGKGS
ncbi:MAG: zinc-ribbon domain-containing protein [Acidobacteriota bacterium]